MATPTLAYCAERGRLLEGESRGRSDASITPDLIKTYTRRGRELRAEAFTDGLANLVRSIASFVRAVGEHQSNRRAIRELRAMPDYILKDIGISRSDIPVVVQGIAATGRGGNEYRVRGASRVEPVGVDNALREAA